MPDSITIALNNKNINFKTLNSLGLKNKVILITGVTKGIGRELAISLAKNGVQTILLAKNKKKLEEVYQEVIKLKENNFELDILEPALVPFNLAGANPNDYQDLANSIGMQYGRLDGLVHNAATLGIKTEIIHYDILKWYETLQVNLNAPFLLTKFCLPLLKLSKQSSIIFTTSNESLHGAPYQGAYGLSKAAIKNFMETLAAECEAHTNIRINAINPNRIYSGIFTQNYPGTYPDAAPAPNEIMPLYLYLLGDFTDRVHGQTITFNGNGDFTVN